MNIFILSSDPYEAAQLMCDKHIIKMISETWQMLSWSMDNVYEPVMDSYTIFRTHKNHPCTIWVNETQGNYTWACQHLEGLMQEYDLRYPNRLYNFKSQRLFLKHAAEYTIQQRPGARTPFVQCMPDKYKCDDAVKAYRAYYLNEKMHFAKWKLGIPDFVNNNDGKDC